MARNILGVRRRTTDSLLSERQLAPAARNTARTRSSRYVALLAGLDVGAGNESNLARFLEQLRAELAELSLPEQPVGWLAACRLGAPYDVHSLDSAGNIVRHYHGHEALPGLYARARTLAMHPAYLFVELYPNYMIGIRADGTASRVDS